MKKKICFAVIVFLGAICFSSSLDEVIVDVSKDISERCGNKEIVAIHSFSAETAEMRDYIQSQLTSVIFENSTLHVVTRAHIDKVEEEIKYQYSGAVSDSTAISIGKRLGAQKIVFGSLEELENKYTLQIKMLDVEKGSYSLFKKYEINRSSKTEQLL